MVNLNLKTPKLVVPASLYCRRLRLPVDWHKPIGDANYSAFFSGRTGSGKDVLTLFFMEIDLAYNRSVVVLDQKGEYTLSILGQNDVVLRNILIKNGLAGRGHRVVLWIPYVEGMEKFEAFQKLLRCHHPNLEIRPFRFFIDDFLSDDSYNMALAKTQFQSMALDDEDIGGSSGKSNEIKEKAAEKRMAIDREFKWFEGCGWEYIQLDELTRNKKVNVITTQFMSTNTVAATSFNIAIMNELLIISKGVNRIRRPDEVFTIIIPEIEVLLPRTVTTLKNAVDILGHSIKVTLQLMRYYDVRIRANLQNLSALDPGMVAQAYLFAGKTWNVKDLRMLRLFNVSQTKINAMADLPIGNFYKVPGNGQVSVIPFCHKAREREYIVPVLDNWMRDPSTYLFETKNYFLAEPMNYPEIFYDGKKLTVQEYNRRMRNWIKRQPKRNLPSLMDRPIRNTDELRESMKQRCSSKASAGT